MTALVLTGLFALGIALMAAALGALIMGWFEAGAWCGAGAAGLFMLVGWRASRP